jgi:outer membrane protein
MGGLGLRTYLLGLALVTAGLAASCAAIASSVVTARADTLEWALVQAYQNNPSLNAQRAALRATDENVPQALSG